MVLNCSNGGEQRTLWTRVQPLSSAVLISSNSGGRLTGWCSAIVVSGSDLLKQWRWRATHWLERVQPSVSSVALICSNSGEQLTPWTRVQPLSSIRSDLLKHQRATHNLDACSAIVISGSDLLEWWRATYCLDACSAIVVSGSDLRERWRATHCLDGVQPSSSVVLICSNIGERLTS